MDFLVRLYGVAVVQIASSLIYDFASSKTIKQFIEEYNIDMVPLSPWGHSSLQCGHMYNHRMKRKTSF